MNLFRITLIVLIVAALLAPLVVGVVTVEAKTKPPVNPAWRCCNQTECTPPVWKPPVCSADNCKNAAPVVQPRNKR